MLLGEEEAQIGNSGSKDSMKVYVVGAGVSNRVGYPLGGDLFEAIDEFIWTNCPSDGGPNYAKDWCKLLDWLKHNENPLIVEAFQTRQLEHLFTILDLVRVQRLDACGSVVRAKRKDQNAAARADAQARDLLRKTDPHAKYRETILQALEAYFRCRHHADSKTNQSQGWEELASFGRKVCPSDVVITFNYDATLERVLWQQRKWSPTNGYGFEAGFQKSPDDKTPVPLPESEVTVLHLHGAIGWYEKPYWRPGYVPTSGGAVDRKDIAPGPIGTPVALDPMFLRDLDIPGVDASLPTRPADEHNVFIHPSFIKSYDEGPRQVFIKQWRMAADFLKEADEIHIIGYSLPEADSASLTLLATNCGSKKKVDIINSDPVVNHKLRRLLSANVLRPPVSFQEWLKQIPDCSPA
jgi:ABC-type transporter Mla MlaB component